MGQIIEEIIEDFTEGITDDPRRKDPGLSQIVTNFDIFTNKKRMIPLPESEDGDSASATSKKQNFDIGFWTPSSGSWRLFALGVVSGTARAEVLMKTLTTGGSTDLSDNTWATPAANQSASGSTAFSLFKYYKNQGKFYGAKSGSTIWAFTPDGSTAFDDSSHSLSYTTIGQGIVHSKDDCLYIPYDNKIARNNAGSWTDVAISIPANFVITSIAEHENFVVIAAAPLSGVGKSIHYLWDRDSSLTTLSESYDGGEGQTKIIESLNGDIVSVALVGNNQTRIKNRIVLRHYSGSGFKNFLELVAPISTNISLLNIKQKVDNRVYFLMSITIDGVLREGLWSIGITKNGGFGLAHESSPNNDTPVIPSNGILSGFFIVGDYKFISYVAPSGDFALSKTADSPVYNTLSIYETTIKNKNNSDIIAKLIGGSLIFEPSPANGRAALYYKKDAESVWTRMFTYNVQNAISKGAVNIESDTNPFTVTVASPAVFTLANHGLAVGQKVKLRTTIALPTGLTAGVEYYVISSGLTSSTFKLSATSGGSAINTTGTQSGVHTIDRTYNLPEGKEFKFRAESTGGLVITGLRYKMETVDKQLY